MQAFFLPSDKRKIFSVFHPAKGGEAAKFILHIPAFAEEMNCARHIISQQCRELANQGYSVLQIDLSGTGDSSGEFSEATWEGWKQDVETASQWLASQGAKSVTFWGLRLGALLAIDCVAAVSLKVEKLILWQPVLTGELFLMQFLRLKTAAAMMDGNSPAVKVSEFKRQLLSGQSVEVAGYLLNSELATAIISLDALQLDLPADIKVALFDISNKKPQLSRKNLQFIELLKSKNNDVDVRHVSGSSFWVTHGNETLSELNLATLECCL